MNIVKILYTEYLVGNDYIPEMKYEMIPYDLPLLESKGMLSADSVNNVLNLLNEYKENFDKYSYETFYVVGLKRFNYNTGQDEQILVLKVHKYGNYNPTLLIPQLTRQFTTTFESISEELNGLNYGNFPFTVTVLNFLSEVIISSLGMDNGDELIGVGFNRIAIKLTDGVVMKKMMKDTVDNLIEYSIMRKLNFKTSLNLHYSESSNHLITSYVEGKSLSTHFKEDSLTDSDVEVIAEQILSLITELKEKKFSYYDLHFNNFIWNDDTKQLTLIDIGGLGKDRDNYRTDFIIDAIMNQEFYSSSFDFLCEILIDYFKKQGWACSIDEDVETGVDRPKFFIGPVKEHKQELFAIYPELKEHNEEEKTTMNKVVTIHMDTNTLPAFSLTDETTEAIKALPQGCTYKDLKESNSQAYYEFLDYCTATKQRNEIESALREFKSCEISFTCEGRSRHQWQSEAWLEGLNAHFGNIIEGTCGSNYDTKFWLKEGKII